MRSISTNDSDGPGTSTPCHSDSVPNSDCLGVVCEPLYQRRGGVVALAQHRGVEALPHDLGGGLGGAHR